MQPTTKTTIASFLKFVVPTGLTANPLKPFAGKAPIEIGKISLTKALTNF